MRRASLNQGPKKGLNMKKHDLRSKILVTIFLGLTLAACGGSLRDETVSAKNKSGNTGNTEGSGGGGNGGFNPPPLVMRVGTVGYNCSPKTVQVKDVLKVRFSPGINDEFVSGTGTSPQYSKLGVYIKVENTTQMTALLSNGLASAAQSSPVINFSNAFTKTCAGDPECRQNVTIEVCQPNYDYWCYNFGTYCPHTHVHQNHPWNGELEVQTDDTEAL